MYSHEDNASSLTILLYRHSSQVRCQTAWSGCTERSLHIHTSPAHGSLRQRNVINTLTSELPVTEHSREMSMLSHTMFGRHLELMTPEDEAPRSLREMSPIRQLRELEEMVCAHRLMYL